MELNQPFSLTSPLDVADGGTGVSSFNPYAVITGGVTSTGPLQQVSGLGTSGFVLTSNGPGTLPTWQTGGGGGTVTSVSGTLNRITSTGGTDPIIDISASYVGQSSITTLGTISTGVWNGTSIANANLANSTITVNGTSTALGSSVTITTTGTSNRISVSGGTGLTPTIDIAATYVGQNSITTLGTISTGVWQGTKVGLLYGGTNADLSGTGGTSQYLKQSSLGAAITVGTIPASDIASGAALTRTNDTNVTLTLGGTPGTALLVATSLTLGWTGQLGLARGGTNADLSATGGTSQVLKQVSSGATITVGQLAASDLSNGTTGSGGGVVLATGPTMSNPIVGTQTSTDNSTKAASTSFVTTAVQNALNGLDWKQAVGYATTANVVGTNTAGVFTYTATGVDAIDGHNLVLNDVVLFKNQTTGADNGVWVVTTAGAIGIAGILTRRSDYNTAADIQPGDAFYVLNGTVNTNTTWVQTATVNTINVDALSFSQAAGPGSYTQGNGITITGVSIAIDTSVTVDKTTSQTLTNKTLTTPVINGLPTGTGVANTNTASTLVARDGSGNFSAGTITAALTGNASTATALLNARTIGGVSFDGTANITVATATGGFTISGGNLAIDARNISTDTTTGTKFGTATNQKIAFYNATPIVQPTGDVITALQNLGLGASLTVAATTITSRTLWGQTYDGSANVTGSLTAVGNITGGASSMTITAGTGNSRTLALQSTTSGGTATTFLTGNADQSTTFGGNVNVSAFNIVTDTTTGTKFGTATNQKISFYNSAPIVQPTGNALTALSNLGLVATPTLLSSDVGLGSVTNDAQTKASIVPNTAPSAGQILVGNAGGTAYAPQTISGSGATITLSSAGVATISAIANASLSNSAITINGSSTSLGGSVTITTTGTSNRISISGGGGLTPTIDISATYVGQSSITTLGTIATGTWSATTIALNKGGTGQTTKAAAFDALSPMSTGGDIIYGGSSGTGTRLANGSSGQVLTSAGTTLAPTWQTPTTGTVTSVSVVTTNGFSGSVATATTTPAITLSLSGSSDTQVLYNNGGSSITGSSRLTWTNSTGTLLVSDSLGHQTVSITRNIITFHDTTFNGFIIGEDATAASSNPGTGFSFNSGAGDGNKAGGDISVNGGDGGATGSGGNINLFPGLGKGGAVNGTVGVGDPTSSIFAIFDTSVLATANKTFKFPNASGTFAVSASGNIALSALGNITFTGQLPVANGGTALSSIAALSLLVANSANTFVALTPGAGQSIRINAGNTAWEAYTPTSGTVTSVSGTTNRITSTGGATPVIDISASYVGQSSITTLGTVTTGTLSTGAIIGGVTMTLGSDASFDIYYRNGSGILTRLANGTTGQLLTATTSSAPSWVAPATNGTVTTVSVVSANGFAGTVANAGTTPAITLTTSINAPILSGNGTAIAAATTTGSGTTAVLSTTPTFTTSIITPLVIGGAAAGSSLSLQSTSASGTTDFINFLVGNAGATESMRIIDSGLVGIGITSPTAFLHLVGTAPASIGTTPGTNATTVLTVTGAAGGATSIATTGAGGVGSTLSVTTGAGGLAASATTASTGGNGGASTLSTGVGGAAAVAGTGTNTGGNGGANNVTAGSGGAATGATNGVNTGGVGGGVIITAGTGGASNTGTGTLVSGAGGAVTISGGTGGLGTTGTATGGNGGAVAVRGGVAAAMAGAAGGALTLLGRDGSGTGTGGAGGGFSIQSGSAGGDNTVNRAGGTVNITAGNSKGATQNGGSLSANGGDGGDNPNSGTTTGPTGGGVSYTPGNGGTASGATVGSTGGTAGNLSFAGGLGGAASVTGSVNNTGGIGSAFLFNAGTGGAANGNTTGNNLGGTGGAITIQSGTGGSGSNANGTPGTINGGAGGTTTINGGVGGTGTTANGAGGPIIFKTATTTTLAEAARFDNAQTLLLQKTISKYNNISTAGGGVPAIYSAPAISATKSANFTVLSYTPPSTAGQYRVGGVITTTSSTNTGTVQFTLDYVDSQGTTHTADIIALQDAAGVIATTKSGASKEFHAMGYNFTINNAGTAIVLKVVVTGTVSYTVTGSIEQII